MSIQTKIKDEIVNIGESTCKKLQELKIPPYPKYYKDTFIDILESHEDEDLKLLVEKYPQLFFEKTSSLQQDEKNLLCAQESVKEFENSNEIMKKLSDENEIELSNITKNNNADISNDLVELCSHFQTSISEQLKIADNVIIKMRNKIEQLEKESNLHPLTKMFKEKMLKKYLKELLKFGLDKDLQSYLIIIDADNFKAINRDFGRIAGDKTLVYLATLLQNLLRHGTDVYHTQGGEFTIVLNRVSEEQMQNVVTRILKEISQSKLFYKGNNIHLTVSIGVASHKKEDTYDLFIQRAKQALSTAKLSGKNCYKEVK